MGFMMLSTRWELGGIRKREEGEELDVDVRAVSWGTDAAALVRR